MAVVTTTTKLAASTPEDSPNVQALLRKARDVITGATTATLTASNPIVSGMELVFKNGTLLTPTTDYSTIEDSVVLASAAIAGDVFVLQYYYRAVRA